MKTVLKSVKSVLAGIMAFAMIFAMLPMTAGAVGTDGHITFKLVVPEGFTANVNIACDFIGAGGSNEGQFALSNYGNVAGVTENGKTTFTVTNHNIPTTAESVKFYISDAGFEVDSTGTYLRKNGQVVDGTSGTGLNEFEFSINENDLNLECGFELTDRQQGGGGGQQQENLEIEIGGVKIYENNNRTDNELPAGMTIEGFGSFDGLKLTLSNFNHPDQDLVITGTQRIQIIVDGNCALKGLRVGDGVDAEFECTSREIEVEDVLTIGEDGIHGEGDRCRLNFWGENLKLVVNATQANGKAFDGFGEIDFSNYNFHKRERTNNVINAGDTAFENVGLIEVKSSKVSVNAAKIFGGFATGPNTSVATECVVFQEGVIDSTWSNDGGFGLWYSKYFANYPGDGHPLDSEVNTHDVENDPAFVQKFEASTWAQQPEGRAKDSLVTSGSFPTGPNNPGHLVVESKDPILYSVSYTVDEDKRNNPDFGNPDAGDIMIRGFEKGYWTTRSGRDDAKFEAWIAAGQDVEVTILPDAGYQYISGTLVINADVIDTGRTGEAKGSYTFRMPENAGHICAGFKEVQNVAVVNDDAKVKDAAFFDDGSNAANGSLKLSVAAANPSAEEMEKINNEATIKDGYYINLDLKLSEVVVKNFDPAKSVASQDAWETNISDLNTAGTVGVQMPDDFDMDSDIEIVRIHNGVAKAMKIVLVDKENRVVYFEADGFSLYSLVYRAPSSNSSSGSSNNNATAVPVKDSVPKTGESNGMIYMLMALASAALIGMGAIAITKKRKER